LRDHWNRRRLLAAERMSLRRDRMSNWWHGWRDPLSESWAQRRLLAAERMSLRRDRMSNWWHGRWDPMVAVVQAWTDGNRRPANVAAVAVIVVLVGITAAMMVHPRGTQRRARTDARRPVVGAVVPVPPMRGLAAVDVRSVLEDAGLTLLEVRPALGKPGIVLRTQPVAGTNLREDAAVTVIVGVDSQRLEAELRANGAHGAPRGSSQ
jgi:hypothetical protein